MAEPDLHMVVTMIQKLSGKLDNLHSQMTRMAVNKSFVTHGQIIAIQVDRPCGGQA
jgi:hypothetical protein